MKYWIPAALLATACAPCLIAQLMATAVGRIPPESVGLPPQPPFITLLGIANPGRMATDPSIPPKGPIAEVIYEELRPLTTPAGRAGEVEASVRTKYDEKGNITAQIENRFGSTTDSVYLYQDDRLVGIESTFPDARRPQLTAFNYWTYDSNGKLTEYRRGRGAEIQNHEINFRYDSQGRLLAFDYRQGKDDKLFSHTDIGYSSDDRTVVVTRTFPGNKIASRSTRVLDGKGRVVRVSLTGEGRPAENLASVILFVYDEQGRLLGQTTNATKLSKSGVENDLPPGTISITYDDNSHTRTTKYTVPGPGDLEATVQQDAAGATVAFRLKAEAATITSKLECEQDRQGNWTLCRQISIAEGQTVTKTFRRTITYR